MYFFYITYKIESNININHILIHKKMSVLTENSMYGYKNVRAMQNSDNEDTGDETASVIEDSDGESDMNPINKHYANNGGARKKKSDDDDDDDDADESGIGLTDYDMGASESDASESGADTDSDAGADAGTLTLGVDSESIGESDYDSDGYDEDYLQKFTKSMRDDLIINCHPESRSHNYEEIKQLAKVTRNKNGIVVDELHKTIPMLTKYEKTRILGQRAKQIETGATPMVKVPPNIIDSYLIANLELTQNKIPFIIRRPLPNGGTEYWYVSDLEDL